MITITRGNTYDLPITLKISGFTITSGDVKSVEFHFDDLVKRFPEDVKFEDNVFNVQLSQQDTLSLTAKNHASYMTRVLFNNGKAKSSKRQRLIICETMAEGVLE